jgi:hypothetical protein
MKKLSKEQILGIIRHLLTIIGGVLIAKGYTEEDVVGEAIGGVMSLVGVIWSIREKSIQEPPVG